MSTTVKTVLSKIDQMEKRLSTFVSTAKPTIEKKLSNRVELCLDDMQSEINRDTDRLEAKIALIAPPKVIKTYRSVIVENNARLRSDLKAFMNSKGKQAIELKLFEDENHHDAFMREASALTGSAAGIGGRTGYDPTFVSLRQGNPLRAMARSVSVGASTYEFRVKSGNAGASWGYTVANNTPSTTEDTNIWRMTLKDLNCQFPVRSSVLDDVDGLEGTLVTDLIAEFAQAEAQSMVLNNDQVVGGAYGGTEGLRGLATYPGMNATYTPGTTSVASFGTSGFAPINGIHKIATYDQITTNGSGTKNNLSYQDLINFIFSLPTQYQSPNNAFMINPEMLNYIRSMVDTNGAPIFVRTDPLVYDGTIGELLGYRVFVNQYLPTPTQATAGAAGTTSLCPMWFGDWTRGFTIIDRLSMLLQRFDQTLPGSITFFGETRLQTSVRDPFALVRYRSTATAS